MFRSLFWIFFVCCRADVQCPLIIDHGRILTTCRRLAGDVCKFTCNEGYQLGVPETTMLLCGSDGKWNQTSELCKGRVLVSIKIKEYLFKVLLAVFVAIAGSLKIISHKHGIVYFKLLAFFIQLLPINFYSFIHLRCRLYMYFIDTDILKFRTFIFKERKNVQWYCLNIVF